MTNRERNIIKAILQYLHDADYGQRVETQIHAGAFKAFDETLPSVNELTMCLRLANAMQFIRGVPSRFERGMKWNLTDAGEAALQELNGQ